MSGNEASSQSRTEHSYNQVDQLTKIIKGAKSSNPLITEFVLDSRGHRVMTSIPNVDGSVSIDIYDVNKWDAHASHPFF